MQIILILIVGNARIHYKQQGNHSNARTECSIYLTKRVWYTTFTLKLR
jgi:hypothetical protein